MMPEMTPKQVYEACCTIPDPVKAIGLLASYHVARLLQHLESLPDSGVPALIRGLAEERAVVLFRKEHPLSSEDINPFVAPFPQSHEARAQSSQYTPTSL